MAAVVAAVPPTSQLLRSCCGLQTRNGDAAALAAAPLDNAAPANSTPDTEPIQQQHFVKATAAAATGGAAEAAAAAALRCSSERLPIISVDEHTASQLRV